MKSKASISSHPVHPILVSFPIAFFTATVIADACRILLDKPELAYTASLLNIAGIVGAVLAAVPGVIDFINTVPPKSSGKKRAARHGIINSTMLLLFIVVYIKRDDTDLDDNLLLAIEVVAWIMMGIAGWMGGTLVYRNQIGVDVRYAHAGKWKEESFEDQGRIEIGNADMLEVNQMKLLHVGNKRIVIGRTETKYVAFQDHCTHKGASLAGGSMICGTVQCPWHGSQFNCETGSATAGPATENITTYHVTEANGRLTLHIEKTVS